MEKLHLVHPGDNDWHVVFVHGLNLYGSEDHYRTTWGEAPDDPAKYFPVALGRDTGCAVWLAEYLSDASTLGRDTLDLQSQGAALLDRLLDRAFGGKPLVLVGHSLGGLVIKEALNLASDKNRPDEHQAVLDSIRLVAFIASPHKGAALAKWAWLLRWAGVVGQFVGALESDRQALIKLNTQFVELRAQKTFDAMVFREGARLRLAQLGTWRLPWPSVMVVSKDSADPDLRDSVPIDVPRDHIEIARPAGGDDEPFYSLKRRLKELMQASGVDFMPDDMRAQLQTYAKNRLEDLRRLDDSDLEFFVPLYLQPRKLSAEKQSEERVDRVDSLFARHAERYGWLFLGDPGSGKTTLLREYEARRLEALVAGAPAELAVTISLRGLTAESADEVEAWLESRWRELWPRDRTTKAPTLANVRRVQTVRLLLDGLNEIEARSAAHRQNIASALAAWMARCAGSAGHEAPVFSVRTLDYTDPLELQGRAPRMVEVRALEFDQIADFAGKRVSNPSALARLRSLVEPSAELRLLFSNPYNLRVQCDLLAGGFDLVLEQRAQLMGAMIWRSVKRLLGSGAPVATDGSLFPDPMRAHVLTDQWCQAGQPASLYTLGDQCPLFRALEGWAYSLQLAAQGGVGRSTYAEAQVHFEDPALRVAGWRAMLAMGLVVDEHGRLVDADDLNRRPAGAAPGLYCFRHQLVQEFFAARRLLRTVTGRPGAQVEWPFGGPPALPAQDRGQWDSLTLPPNPPWTECVRMLAEMLPDRRALVEGLLAIDQLILAGRAVAAAPAVDAQDALSLEVQRRLLARCEGRDGVAPMPQANDCRGTAELERDLRLRWHAGTVLGEVGDRLRYVQGEHAGHRFLRPADDRWVEVPAGRYVAGGLTGRDADGWPASRDRVPFELDRRFRMAFAPVTNAEFACFILAGGYGDKGAEPPERWWREAAGRRMCAAPWRDKGFERWARAARALSLQGWDHWLQTLHPDERAQQSWIRADDKAFEETLERWCSEEPIDKPAYWLGQAYANPLQPVIGVSLYEALAYCRWLDECWQSDATKPEGWHVTLPNEGQWEAAARGPEGLPWPWESLADDRRPPWLNSQDAGLRRPSPVGVFGSSRPGAAPGLMDMAGNVWNWTTSAFTPRGPDPKALGKPAADEDSDRAVRGGSWSNPSDNGRAAIRDWLPPTYRNYGLGFRVLVCPIRNPEP